MLNEAEIMMVFFIYGENGKGVYKHVKDLNFF